METTALGAAYLAGIAEKVWSGVDEVESFWRVERRFEPHMPDADGFAACTGLARTGRASIVIIQWSLGMRTLFLNPPSFEGFRWRREFPLAGFARNRILLVSGLALLSRRACCPDSKVVDAPPHKISIEQTVAMAKDYDLLVLFHVDAGLPSRIQDPK